MNQDRITEIWIEGLRTILSVRLRLNPFTVLTGDNGSGKSTIIEACQILHTAADQGFLDQFIRIHDGLNSIHNQASAHVTLGVRMEGRGDPIEYSFRISNIAGLAVTHEVLEVLPSGSPKYTVLDRRGRIAKVLDATSSATFDMSRIPGGVLLLTAFGLRIPHPAIERTIRALNEIEVHVPFSTLPAWVVRTMDSRLPSLRTSRNDLPTDSLSTLGLNLANVFQSLKELSSWNTTMDYVRLGLGDDIKDIVVNESPNDALELSLRYEAFDQPVPARSLSDGTLGYLSFVALFRLNARRSLVAFDEPENQLHPMMASRVVQFLEVMSKDQSILVATHSDRILDSLSDPASSVVLCALDWRRQTSLMRPDKKTLFSWLAKYRGFGDLRSAGHESSVMTDSLKDED